MKFLKKLFSSKEPQNEVATIKISRLRYWIDLQFKPLLESDFEQLRALRLNSEQFAAELDDLIHKLSVVTKKGERLTVLKEFEEQKSLLNTALHRLYRLLGQRVDESILSILDFYAQVQDHLVQVANVQKRVGHVIAQYAPEEYRHIKALLQKIVTNHESADAILIGREFSEYIQVQTHLETYKKKIVKHDEIQQKIDKSNLIYAKHQDLLKQNYARYERLTTDRRYELERESMRKNNSKLSFYEYEKQDAEGKLREQKSHLDVINRHIESLQHQLAQVQPQKELHKIRLFIQGKFGIELEFAPESSADEE